MRSREHGGSRRVGNLARGLGASVWIWLPAGADPAAALRDSRRARARVATVVALGLVATSCAVLAGAAAPLADLT